MKFHCVWLKASRTNWICIKIKRWCTLHRKRMRYSLLQKIWKNSFRPLSNCCPISSSISNRFECLKTWWVPQLGLYKTSLYSKDKDATIKVFSLKPWSNLIHLSSNTKPPYLKYPISSSILSLNWTIFVPLEALSRELQMLLEF
jgi:hypothetical protein